jgi:hypothetical protein
MEENQGDMGLISCLDEYLNSYGEGCMVEIA